MENGNSRYRFVLVSALFAGLVACGDQATNQQAAQAAPAEEVAQCSMAMPKSSTALQVQRAVEDVLAGRLDPCGGTVDLKATSRELLRIDAEDLDIVIFFRILKAPGNRYQVP
jgi:hypothetical protein